MRCLSCRFAARFVGIALLTAWLQPAQVRAEEFGGVEFPDGVSSFADSVIRADPLFSGGPAATNPNFVDPAVGLGAPDYSSGTDLGSYSLGNGGLIELAFTDNLLTNSGTGDDDLYIFEIGPLVEDTFVAIRPTAATLALLPPTADADSDGFFEVGKVTGSTSGVDIDSFFMGFMAGELQFDAVQLIDDPNESQTSGPTVGADIDAVGAIASTPIPEPSTFVLLAAGITALAARLR